MIDFPHLAWDIYLVKFFNQFCGKSIFLDTLAVVFLSVDALRTALLVALVLGIWHYGKITGDLSSQKRVVSILLSIVITLGSIEILNAVIDSPRPAVTYENTLKTPLLTADTKELWKGGWVRNPKHGSFPSDTVALLSTMAIGLFLWNRMLGAIAILFVCVAGILPRLYFGLHYPSDMILGFIIALFSSLSIDKIKSLDKLYKKIFSIEKQFPYVFGVLGFYLAYIIADKFILIRKLPVWIKAMLSGF